MTEAIVMAIGMGVLGGPAMAWAFTTKKPMARYRVAKEKFLGGQGKDPDRHSFGSHKPFWHNAIRLGLMMGTIGFAIGAFAD